MTAPPPGRHDVAVLTLVGMAHFFSHSFKLSLAPLFPLIKAEFGIGYAALHEHNPWRMS